MAVLSITPANVQAGDDAAIQHGIAGAAITAGQLLYKDITTDPDNPTLKLADADAAASAVLAGIALHAAEIGHPIAYQSDGTIEIGATTIVGKWYVCSNTAGGIEPIEDIDVGDYPSLVGLSEAVGEITMYRHTSTVALAS